MTSSWSAARRLRARSWARSPARLDQALRPRAREARARSSSRLATQFRRSLRCRAPPGPPNEATWLWNGSDWSKTSAPTPYVVFGGGTLATDPVAGRAMLLTRGPFAEPALGAAQPGVPNARAGLDVEWAAVEGRGVDAGHLILRHGWIIDRG